MWLSPTQDGNQRFDRRRWVTAERGERASALVGLTDRGPPQALSSVRIRYGVEPGEPMAVLYARLVLAHLGAVYALLFYPPNLTLLLLFATSFLLRMWAVEAVTHRYFCHQAFKTSRAFQFVLAFISCLSGQRGPLWWASTHFKHHRNADRAGDPHSPATSFWHAQVGWYLTPEHKDTDLDLVPHLARFPELRWLSRRYVIPLYGTGLLILLAGWAGWFGGDVSGLAALCWGLFLPAVSVLHVTNAVASFCHSPGLRGGYRRFATPDASINRPLLALLTLGGGFHNNHHRFPTSARVGLAWYEIDLSYWSFKLLERLGLIWNLRNAPEDGTARTARVGSARPS
jgi:stearoyl-CoA desaturase (Delta-9 desaturase)